MLCRVRMGFLQIIAEKIAIKTLGTRNLLKFDDIVAELADSSAMGDE